MDLDLEDDGLTGQLLGVIVSRERDVDVLLLTGTHAGDLLLKAGDEGVGTELQLVVLALATRKGLAVLKALEVDHGGVPLLCRAVDRGDAGNVLGHAVQLGLDLGLLDLDLGLLDLEILIFAKLSNGIQIRHDRQRDGAVVGDVHLGNARAADGTDVLRQDGILVDIREHILDSVLKEDMLAIGSLDDHTRSMTLAEAGDHDILAVLQIGAVQGRLQLLTGQFHRNGCAGRFFLYAFDIHF